MILGVHFGDFWNDSLMKIENWRKVEKSHGVQARVPKSTILVVQNGQNFNENSCRKRDGNLN